MKILIVANRNRGAFVPFVAEQGEALRRIGQEVMWFGVKGHGVWGYLLNLPRLWASLLKHRPDVIHAHYGLCGTLACLQPFVPVVTTYHGSDINIPKIRRLCRPALRRSRCNLFVSKQLMALAGDSFNPAVFPCGVFLDAFPLVERQEARQRLGLDADTRYVLFASAFDNAVKNAPLAQESMRQLPEAKLLELKGYSREEVALLMRAVDCLLMTSHSEGSPQVVKEAMACNLPIVSVDVGDVAWLTEGMEGCLIAQRDPDDIARCLRQALAFGRETRGRERLEALGLDNRLVANHLANCYAKVLHPRRNRQ